MVTNKLWMLSGLLLAATASGREAASSVSCQTAANQPSIAHAKAALELAPNDLRARFNLADAWSDAGCFHDALQVLQSAVPTHPGNKELETRVRVARSLVGEERYFDNLDRAEADAKTKRNAFRCTALNDLDGCIEALRMRPDDPALLTAQGDALVRMQRPAEALTRYRRVAALAPNYSGINQKMFAAEAQLAAQQREGARAANAAERPAAAVSAAARRAAAAEPNPSPLAASADRSALRVAHAPAGRPAAREYTNTAPETRSH